MSLKLAGIAAFAALAFLVASCGDFKKSSVVNPPSNGSLDFTTYVALGNSLTAGYQNGALYKSAQLYSYPNLIAQQTGSQNFQQPLISDPGIGGRLKIVNIVGPVIGSDPVQGGQLLNASLNRPYNNLGVPGAILYDLIDTSNFAAKALPPRNNPFFSIVLRSSVFGSSAVAQALNLKPTFISVWIGANDVLGYASSGGTVGTDPATHSLPTDQATFAYLYNQTMSALLAGAPNAKFATANIPDVTAIPFFTTVPAVVINPQTQQPVTVNGQFVPLIVQRHDPSGKLYVGQANPVYDLILLTAMDSLRAGVGIPTALGGTGRPLGTQFVLDSLEVARVRNATQGFNQVIAAFANSNSTKVVMVDAYSILNNIKQNGYMADGVALSSTYISGGFFGLDGVHPTSRGYAVVANEFIQAINAHFGSNIPLVPLSQVPGSAILAKALPKKILWPEIHLGDLQPTLRLMQQSDLY
ncbi:MAG: SGNH/GDSL hydrolase family protein [Candidatus Kryptoniota bacterium]